MKHIIILSFILLPLFIFAQSEGVSEIDDTWEFVDEKPGLLVYTRESSSSCIKEIRIKVEMKGSIDTLLDIVYDAVNFGDWVYKCSDSESVKVPEGYSSAYAATTDFPFPMADRELVAKTKHWEDEDGRYHTHSLCAADEIPIKSGVVRIETYESRWVMEQIAEDSIAVDYVSSVDPGGKIPAWVVNLAITTGPMKTFEKLIALVEKRCQPNTISIIR